MANLSMLAVGSKVALRVATHARCHPHLPSSTWRIYEILRSTKTEHAIGYAGSVLRVRQSDGKVIGGNFDFMVPATPEMEAEAAATIEQFDRYYRVQREFNAVMETLKQRYPSIEDMERIVAAVNSSNASEAADTAAA